MSLILEAHRKYLSDVPRIAAFRKAIEEIVHPGDCAVDLGCGTGIMGLMACRAGASRVYAIESEGIIGLARAIASDNGYGGRIQFLRGLSTRLEIPEKVDVVITDQIGRFGFEAGIVQYFQDAVRRFLKPGGKLIPSAVDLCVAPVTCPALWDGQNFWNQSPAGFDFRAARQIAGNARYPFTYGPRNLLARPGIAARIDLYHADAENLAGSSAFEIEHAGQLHGIGGWFQAQLSPSVMLTNSPLSPERINRRNVLLPIERPVDVHPGDRVTVELRIIPSEKTTSWTVLVETGIRSGQVSKQRFANSTLLGTMFSQEDLDRTRLGATPRLTPWGEARRTVLELVDGRRPLQEVELELFRRHPDLFPSLKQAAVFVAEAITRYAV